MSDTSKNLSRAIREEQQKAEELETAALRGYARRLWQIEQLLEYLELDMMARNHTKAAASAGLAAELTKGVAEALRTAADRRETVTGDIGDF